MHRQGRKPRSTNFCVTEHGDQDLVQDFERLREACIALRTLSNEFKQLFTESDKPTLDAVASAMLQTIHDSMIEVWWMRAGRLMDPASSSGQNNLTFANILGRLEKASMALADCDNVWRALQETWGKMKPARDKQIAHSDLLVARQGTWLGSISESEGEAFENNLQVLCNLIGTNLGVGPLDFRATGCVGDAADLVAFLEMGLRASDAWRHAHGPSEPVRSMYRDYSTARGRQNDQ
jgi:hypothetical protein